MLGPGCSFGYADLDAKVGYAFAPNKWRLGLLATLAILRCERRSKNAWEAIAPPSTSFDAGVRQIRHVQVKQPGRRRQQG